MVVFRFTGSALERLPFRYGIAVQSVKVRRCRVPVFIIAVLLALLQSCSSEGVGQSGSVDEPGLGGAQSSPQNLPQSGVLQALDDAYFEQQSPVQRYRTTNKLLATLYRGISVDEFLDLESGLETPELLDSAPTITMLHDQLTTPLSVSDRNRADLAILGSEDTDISSDYHVEAAFTFSNEQAREIPLARIVSYPLSFDVLSQWMSWQLSNSILFSPAAELDSVGMNDVQNVFRRLDRSIMADVPIREIVFEHMRSLENWRRFRSPEDNTREMMEIFLHFEDLDDQVPAASKACQDLYLTPENEGYMLAYTDYANTEAQTVLGQTIVNCDDFYNVIANHENLIPTIAATIIDYLYAEQSQAYKFSIVEQLMSRNPQTFADLFLPILFSRSYLIDNERLKSFEEAFLATAQKINWEAPSGVFRGMASGNGGSGRTYMSEMGWPAMDGKLGRNGGIPTDSLSFANFHKALREDLLTREYLWRESFGLTEPSPPDPAPVAPLSVFPTQAERREYEEAVELYRQSLPEQGTQERYDYDIDLARYEKNLKLHSKLKLLSIEDLIDYLFLSVVERKALPVEQRKLYMIFDKEGFLREEDEGIYINRWSRGAAATVVMDYLSRLPETYYLQGAGVNQ